MREVSFLEAFTYSNDFIIDLYPASSLADLSLASNSEYSRETFLLESVFTEVRYSGLQSCSVRKKAQFCKEFFWNFQNFRTSFPFLVLPECICSALR